MNLEKQTVGIPDSGAHMYLYFCQYSRDFQVLKFIR